MRINKILSFSVVVLLITVVFAGAVSVPAAAQSGTMQFRYNAARTGDYSPVAGSTPSNSHLKWRYGIGNANASPAIANGVVYAASAAGDLCAINATTGTQLWGVGYGIAALSSPAVSNGMVYVGSDDGNLWAIHANNGSVLWKYKTGSDVGSSPAIVNGVVYVGGSNGNLYALYANNGTEKWSFQMDPNAVISSPAYANGMVYVTYTVGGVGEVLGLNVTTPHSTNWADAWRGISFSSPAVANGVVYVGGSNEYLYAINAYNPATLSSTYIGGAGALSSPAYANGVVYVGGSNGMLYAVNTTTHNILWEVLPNPTGWGEGGLSSPAYANGVVYVGSASPDDNIFALKATTGANLWNYTTGGEVYSPVIANGVVYAQSSDGNVYAIGPTPTTLTVTAPATAIATQNFTVKGRLTAGGSGIKSQTVTLDHWNGTAWLSTGKQATTNAAGWYALSRSEAAAGKFYYHTTYAGSATYAASTSATFNVTVSKMPTALNLTATPTTVKVDQNFVLKGKLTASGKGVAGQTVTFYVWNGLTWADTGATSTTNATGWYAHTGSEPNVATYEFLTKYAGSATYTNATATKDAAVTVTS